MYLYESPLVKVCRCLVYQAWEMLRNRKVCSFDDPWKLCEIPGCQQRKVRRVSDVQRWESVLNVFEHLLSETEPSLAVLASLFYLFQGRISSLREHLSTIFNVLASVADTARGLYMR